MREAKDITSNASADKDKNKMLFLMNDVDFGGKTVDFTIYNGVRGNGFTLSDFKISVTSYVGDKDGDPTAPDGSEAVRVEVSLFGDMDGGEVKDVTFDNVKFEVRANNSKIEKIYFAPLAMRARNTNFERAAIRVTEFVIDLYWDHELDEPGFINDAASVYYVGDGVTVSGCKTNVCEKTRK